MQYKTKAVASALTPEDAKSEKKLLASFEQCQPHWFGCDYEYLWQVVYKIQDNESMYTRYTLDSLAEQNHLQNFLKRYKKTVDAVSGKWKGYTEDSPSRRQWKLIRAKVDKSYQLLKERALKNDVGLNKEDFEKLSMNWEQAYLIVREKKFKN